MLCLCLCFFSCHRLKTHREYQSLRKADSELTPAVRSDRRKRDILITRVNEHKLQIGSCAGCGRRVLPGDTPASRRHELCCQFDFDHQRRSQKIKAISKLINRKSSLSKIWEEIKKCLLICANCHVLKSKRRFTQREKNIFKTLKIGHSKDIDPYDGLNYFFQPTALYQYQLCIDYDMRENHNWNRPSESFFALILPLLPVGHSSGFSHIQALKKYPVFRLTWRSTSGVQRSKPFAVSYYDGDPEIALGAALAHREELRASGIPFILYEEDTEKKEQLIAKFYRQFLPRQGSSPAPAASSSPAPATSSSPAPATSPAPAASPAPATSSSPVPAASSSSLSFLEEESRKAQLLHAIALSEALDRRMDQLLGRVQKREAAEESQHPKRRRLH